MPTLTNGIITTHVRNIFQRNRWLGRNYIHTYFKKVVIDVRVRFTQALNRLLDVSDDSIRACEEVLSKALHVTQLEGKRDELFS